MPKICLECLLCYSHSQERSSATEKIAIECTPLFMEKGPVSEFCAIIAYVKHKSQQMFMPSSSVCFAQPLLILTSLILFKVNVNLSFALQRHPPWMQGSFCWKLQSCPQYPTLLTLHVGLYYVL